MRLKEMVKITEILRMKNLGVGIRATAISCNCSRNTVRDVLKRAEKEAVSWPIPEDMDDARLNQLLYPCASNPAHRKTEPDYERMYEELKHPHVNLRLLWTEYKRINPDGLEYVFNTVVCTVSGPQGSKQSCILNASLETKCSLIGQNINLYILISFYCK